MTIDNLSQQLSHLPAQQKRYPPVEQWDPPFCGDMDIQIKKDGSWWYMGTPIGRLGMVKLFASVLCQRDGDYLLVTPVEKVRIQVEATPFVITGWRQQASEHGQQIVLSTNLDDEFILSKQHPIQLAGSHNSAQEVPYLTVHRGLQASLHRNVYYQLAEIAHETKVDGVISWVIHSDGETFCLGQA